MNLLDIASTKGRTYKKVSTIHGGEYHGVCPVCGGNDRFHIWPEQGDYGTFWCRGCKIGGDAIEYLREIEGMSFQAACKEVGKTVTELEEYQKPQFKKPAADTFAPRQIAAPADLWTEHAAKLADWAHEQLLANQEQLDYLAARGITLEAVQQFRLGYNPGEKGKDLYRAREAWGLETKLNKDGKKVKLWLPIGIVIPFYIAGALRRLRIRIPADRRTENSLPYYLVPGSAMDSFTTRTDAKAWFIVEAELDAIAIHAQAGDLTGAMAMGNSTAHPTAGAYELLRDSLWIGNALDYDATEKNGKYENAGGSAATWWKKQFSQAERWPVPVGKDPGDAFKAGINLREWVKTGLPPILTLPEPPEPAAKPATTPATAPVQDHKSGADFPSAPTEPETAADPLTGAAVTMRTAVDGRTYHITDNKTEYARLVAAGEIVFDSVEIQLAIKSGATPEEAASYLNAKQIFPGIRLADVQPYTTGQESARPQYRGKYTTPQETP